MKSRKNLFQRGKSFLEKYERHLSSLALLLGFIIDSLTLRRIDLFIENAVIIGYLAVAAFCIVILNLNTVGRENFFRRMLEKIHPLILIVMQFAFGGLFSVFLVFYSRSASLATSWPFLLILFIHLIGNEVLKKQYTRFNLQVSIYFIALFSYCIFLLPVLIGKMGTGVFVLSGLASIILISFFLFLLRFVVSYNRRVLFPLIAGVFLSINFLYFANAIPPIPLSLKEVGVYHSISKTPEGEYVLQHEKERFIERFKSSRSIHVRQGDPLYIFSSIFAPTKIKTAVFHVWQKQDSNGEWISEEKTELPIVGGRDEGFRTYSLKRSLSPGLWRVNIETARGQLIGRVKFEIFAVEALPQLSIKVR